MCRSLDIFLLAELGAAVVVVVAAVEAVAVVAVAVVGAAELT